jgi:hypothetical protein
MIFLGGGLLLMGVVLPLLMVMRFLESTFFLNFFAYGASLSGFFLGLIGAMTYVREKRR